MRSNRDELQKSVGLQRRAQATLRREDPGEERRGEIEVLIPSLRTEKKSMKSNIDIATIWRSD